MDKLEHNKDVRLGYLVGCIQLTIFEEGCNDSTVGTPERHCLNQLSKAKVTCDGSEGHGLPVPKGMTSAYPMRKPRTTQTVIPE